jgi:hypothetical protein
MNCVVKLTQQMRTEDLRYLQLLERLRHGQCNYDDYELLLTRVVGESSANSLRASPWNKVNYFLFLEQLSLFVFSRLPFLCIEMKCERN